MSDISLHPSIDKGVKKGVSTFTGGSLACHCAANKVIVAVKANVAHNHACGCTKCWKPAGSAFSVIGVVPRNAVTVVAHEEKLAVVDKAAAIQRHACKECGTHMYGRIENNGHPFYGLDFIHTELSPDEGWEEPRFAAFVSSIIEGGGARPEQMAGVRAKLSDIGLPPYDSLNPPLMDAIATHVARQKGIL